MSKTSTSKFFSGCDGYAKGVGLLYERKPRFQTPCGGICTIITLLLLLYWGLQIFLGTFLAPGKFSNVEKYTPIELNMSSGIYEPMSIPQE